MANRLLLDPTPTDGGATTPPPAAPVADPTEGFKAALKKHGDDAAAFARDVFRDLQETRTQLSAVSAKIPKEGSVVLEGEDAAEWTAVRSLGKAADLKTKLDEHAALSQRLAARERLDLVTAAAKAHGFDPDVLSTLVGPDLAIEIKDGKDRFGKDVKVAEVVATADGKEVRTPLDKYAEKAFPKFLPSLKGVDPKAPTAPKRSTVPATVQDAPLNGRQSLKFGRF
jgi:hypothetical protein